jgi:hypothetical protein
MPQRDFLQEAIDEFVFGGAELVPQRDFRQEAIDEFVLGGRTEDEIRDIVQGGQQLTPDISGLLAQPPRDPFVQGPPRVLDPFTERLLDEASEPVLLHEEPPPLGTSFVPPPQSWFAPEDRIDEWTEWLLTEEEIKAELDKVLRPEGDEVVPVGGGIVGGDIVGVGEMEDKDKALIDALTNPAWPDDPPPMDDPSIDVDDTSLYKEIFAKFMGLPAFGRSKYEQWLAGQWAVPATEHTLIAKGLFGEAETPVSFWQYLSEREGPLNRMKDKFVDTLIDRGYHSPGDPPIELIDPLMIEQGWQVGGGLKDNLIRQQVFESALMRRYPEFIAEQMAQQAFSSESIGTFLLSPERLREEKPITFLNYLMARYMPRDAEGVFPPIAVPAVSGAPEVPPPVSMGDMPTQPFASSP